MTSEDGENNFASLILLPAPSSLESNFRNPTLGYFFRLEVSPSPPKFTTFCPCSLSTCCVQDTQHFFASSSHIVLTAKCNCSKHHRQELRFCMQALSSPFSRHNPVCQKSQSLPTLLKYPKPEYVHTCIFLYNSPRLQDPSQSEPLQAAANRRYWRRDSPETCSNSITHTLSYKFSLSTDYTTCTEGLSAFIKFYEFRKGYANCYGRQNHNIPACYTQQFQLHIQTVSIYLFYPATLQISERQILQKKAEPGKSS